MKELEKFTQAQIMGYLTDKIAEDFEVTKTQAKKLLLNALLYNVVIEEIENQINYLLEEE